MATPVTMPPLLKLKRNTTYSGSHGIAALTTWETLYNETCPQAYLFCGAIIDLSAMQAGDSIDIRVRKQLVPGGGYINHSQVNYLNAQPASHPTIFIAPLPDLYGVEITVMQNAGTLRTLFVEVYDAKRLGL